jgi:CPA2 family monovalent cation:H+ antiporter-2
MRDAFAVLFFVSVGMLLDPRALLASPGIVLGALAVVLALKPAVAFVLVWAMRYPLRTALTVGIALAQIGEFSFIIASMGRRLGVLPEGTTNVLVATAVASIVVNPIAYRSIAPIERWVQARPRVSAWLNRPRRSLTTASAPSPRTHSVSHRAVVVGYGPTGRTVVRLLRDNGVMPTVIDLNVEVVRALRDEGIDAVYGDASRPETLAAAAISSAASLVLGSAGMANAAEVIRAAREQSPDIRILARASYLRDVDALRRFGATSVYSGEGEVALAFVEDILTGLGATPEQIDRERARAHEELTSPA